MVDSEISIQLKKNRPPHSTMDEDQMDIWMESLDDTDDDEIEKSLPREVPTIGGKPQMQGEEPLPQGEQPQMLGENLPRSSESSGSTKKKTKACDKCNRHKMRSYRYKKKCLAQKKLIASLEKKLEAYNTFQPPLQIMNYIQRN